MFLNPGLPERQKLSTTFHILCFFSIHLGTIFMLWHRELQDNKLLFKVILQVSLSHVGLVVNPVNGRWLLRQSSQPGVIVSFLDYKEFAKAFWFPEVISSN